MCGGVGVMLAMAAGEVAAASAAADTHSRHHGITDDTFAGACVGGGRGEEREEVSRESLWQAGSQRHWQNLLALLPRNAGPHAVFVALGQYQDYISVLIPRLYSYTKTILSYQDYTLIPRLYSHNKIALSYKD